MRGWLSLTPLVNQSQDGFEEASRDEFYRQLGAKIRARRHENGLKQEALAQTVGLSRTSLTNIEKGRQRLLLHTFCQIAATLRVEPQALLPTGTATLEKLGVELPESMNPEDRDFVARAMSPGVTNEKYPQITHSAKNIEAPSGQRNSSSSRRRRKDSQ